MRILIITPSFGFHGGIRNLISWANSLSIYHKHDVGIFSICKDRPDANHFTIHESISVVRGITAGAWDVLVIGSPHSIGYQEAPGMKKVLFMQQCEHLFRPKDKQWQAMCFEFYRSRHPMILYSQWNHQYVNQFRRGPTYYVGTSVSFDDFPIMDTFKDSRTVLVEGWEPTNPTKDANNIGPRVAERLRKEGYHIMAYSQLPLRTLPKVPHEYLQKPSLQALNDMYSRASILIKATLNDARSASPLEAMTKATPTVRAINQGDDDLMHDVNCLRSGYDEEALYQNAKRLLENPEWSDRLGANGLQYILKNSWRQVIKPINEIITHS